MSNTTDAEGAATCTHGKLVGLANTSDPRECQACDWCPRCGDVREWADEKCVACGRVWGACEECNADPCTCSEPAAVTTGVRAIVTETGLACGACGSADVREWDRAERWNRIDYDPATGRMSISQGDAEFETVGLACADCESELSEPDVPDFWGGASWS